VAALVHEIARAARALASAQSCEVVAWRGRDAAAAGPAHRGRRVGTRRGTARRLARAVVSRSGDSAGLVLPLRHRGRTLAIVRTSFAHSPSPGRVEQFRRYLVHAGAALARVTAEERLHGQHRRYEALLDNLPDVCLLVVSNRGLIRDVRGRAPRLAGSDPGKLVGMPLVATDGRPGLVRWPRGRPRRLALAARERERTEIETTLHAGGGEVPVALTLVDLGAGGDLVCVVRDLSSVKAMEAALLERNSELSKAAERLREIDVLKNEFLSNVSHELRTPLTAIIAYAESLLLTSPAPETQREFVQVICEQGQKLQLLIGGLLDIAKLESLATELKLELGSLNDVVRAAVVTVRPTADRNQIAIELDLQRELPQVWLDELRAQQIVWNLLTNAIKFSAAETTIRVRTWSDDDHVWAAISDQGIGIAPEHQKLVFEKFVQVDGSMNRRQGGVGLGLDLVKHLVELHGGTVGVESTPGRGATFTFNFPIEKRRRPRLGAAPRTEVAARSGD
jgi:signal transduction histidine kinase